MKALAAVVSVTAASGTANLRWLNGRKWWTAAFSKLLRVAVVAAVQERRVLPVVLGGVACFEYTWQGVNGPAGGTPWSLFLDGYLEYRVVT